MLLEETLRKLTDLKLHGMVRALREQMNAPPGDHLSFDEQLGMVVDREWTERDNRRLSRRLKEARLSTNACLEDVYCDPTRGLDKATVRGLSTGQWIRAKQNIIVVGATGVGKSFLGAAFAHAACRAGFRALSVRAPRLLHDLALARGDGSYTKELERIAKAQVLVLDDLLIAPLKDSERRDLLEVLEDRYDRSSTVITTQVPTKNWHEFVGDPTLADAICDRLVHNAHVLTLRGPSIRKKKGLGSDSGAEKKEE